jgi:hypothetical protein
MIGNELPKELTPTDKFIVALHAEFLLSRDPHSELRFRELLADWLKCEVKQPDSEVYEVFSKSSGDGKTEGLDWTQAGRTADGFPVPKGSPEDVTPRLPTQADADAIAYDREMGA